MGRLYEVQAKDLDEFRRKNKRRLQKGDSIRIFGALPKDAKALLDLRPKTKDVLFTKKYTNTLREVGPEINVLEIGKP